MNNVHINQMEINEISNKKKYYSVIESLLFVSGDPLRLKDISEILECKDSFAEGLMIELMNIYENEEQRGIKLIKINEAYQFVTKTCNSNFVQKLLKTNIRQSLSQASLETLAIIAYKQPITRIDIEEIRGVKSDRAIYTLLERKLIKESGRKEVAGRPILYSTTEEFLKYFQLQSLKELPNLDSFDIEEELIDEHDIIKSTFMV